MNLDFLNRIGATYVKQSCDLPFDSRKIKFVRTKILFCFFFQNLCFIDLVLLTTTVFVLFILKLIISLLL